ncbi:hypothetical protein SKAU_G00161050 [Synaphobranchus kaupii]|uniref:Uncharacterized protein n=1 Tax=Synaphobranchus kaupii TaxID=118154 RepID=A0A9Q1IZS4_SYNKA|nr:hypothetical protein SKAU_G00161050 [Synaphobranchus kaupii]
MRETGDERRACSQGRPFSEVEVGKEVACGPPLNGQIIDPADRRQAVPHAAAAGAIVSDQVPPSSPDFTPRPSFIEVDLSALPGVSPSDVPPYKYPVEKQWISRWSELRGVHSASRARFPPSGLVAIG